MEPIKSENLKMVLDVLVLTIANVEKTWIFVINSSFIPFRIIYIIIDLKVLISLAINNHEKVLKVLC